jgi:ABC-type glycerol-3-phosphate transport system substrate-binding protein
MFIEERGMIMKKIYKLFLLTIAAIFVLAACGAPGAAPTAPAAPGAAPIPAEGLSGTLRVWSFTNEAETLATIFQGHHPNVEIDFSMVALDGGQYLDWVTTTLAMGGSGVPDIIFMEADFVRGFIEGPFLRDLSHMLPEARAIDTFQFTIDAATAPDGTIRAWSWQGTPGAMFYRRSLALEYFGTDDPAAIQQLFRDIPTTMSSARQIRDASGGTSFFIPGFVDIYRTFLPNRSQPWIVDNALVVDPLMYEVKDLAMTLRQEGLEAQISAWSPEWFSGMSDTLVAADGTPQSIFAYFMPTWGLPFVIMPNASTATTDTAGDWGMIPGPMPYQWGGTWMGVTAGAQNVAAAEEFVRFVTLNPEHLANWALGVYTNEYLRAINPAIPEGQFQAPGDLVSSAQVIAAIADEFSSGEAFDFLGGQNPYHEFGQIAFQISLDLMQGTDATISDAFIDAVNLFIDGEADSAGAWQNFRNALSISLPDLRLN